MKKNRICGIEGCNNRLLCKGLCNNHYLQANKINHIGPLTVREFQHMQVWLEPLNESQRQGVLFNLLCMMKGDE